MPQVRPVLQSPADPSAESIVTVGFCRADGLFSRAIEWFGGSYYSHVTTLLPDRIRVLDARLHGGVAVRPASYLANTEVKWIDLVCTKQQANKIYAFLFSQVGKKYDTVGIWHFVTGQIHDPNWSSRSAWFCDELAAASWIAGGIARPSLIPLPRLTPGSSAIMASQLNWRPSAFSLSGVKP